MPIGIKKGVRVDSVAAGGAAEQAGLRAGDVILSVDGSEINDTVDYMFTAEGPEVEITFSRSGRKHSTVLNLSDSAAGMELEQFKVGTCGNKCIFCFVSQLPRGMRRPLYLKDEDYRMSFLYGNYVTLTNLKAVDRKRIVKQHLSPLYISVHATDRAVRNRMLGNAKAPDILGELKFLSENRIRFHTQIVLCPGVNDGPVLEQTLKELCRLHPYMLSVAVVPVGLTDFGNKELRHVSAEDASAALDMIEVFRKRLRKKHGDPLVYGSDELFLKAGRPIPPLKEYGDLPQIENGVGMIAQFTAMARKIKAQRIEAAAAKGGVRYTAFTGVSFYPFLKRFADRLAKGGINIEAICVENHFFGPSVTVTGLLTGRDVLRALGARKGTIERLLVPSVVLREGDDRFLDDVTVRDIEKALKTKVIVIDENPEGIMEAIEG